MCPKNNARSLEFGFYSRSLACPLTTEKPPVVRYRHFPRNDATLSIPAPLYYNDASMKRTIPLPIALLFLAIIQLGIPADCAEWPFQLLTRPDLPTVSEQSWCQNPIDHFILAELEAQGLAPSPRAPRETLLRRATMDLLGLPPTIASQQEYDARTNPAAYHQLIDRLLANPSHGERWGQHWLDVVRYADSDGFEYDDPRPHAWRYRDWVIKSLNQDRSIQRFVLDQVAGDELFPGETESLVATGLHRLGPLRLNAGMQDEAKNRQEVLTEMTDMMGAAFLGLTIGCARCHDHKFDDFSQLDYFQLQSFFASTVAHDEPLLSSEARAALVDRQAAWKKKFDVVSSQVTELENKHRLLLVQSTGRDNPSPNDIRTSIEAAPDDHREFQRWQQQVLGLLAAKPAAAAAIMAVSDQKSPVPPTYLLHRGEPGQHGKLVTPAFPQLLQGDNASLTPRIKQRSVKTLNSNPSSGRRTALAQWLVSRKHPLTARVFVNRIWQHHFGQGIVATPNDFGAMGSAASHPRLLDWLACELIDSGWSAKHIHRLIMQSATYQQASQPTTAGMKSDPDNELLWRMNRRRMEAETIRDSLLSVSGRLNSQAGGPGIRLPLNAEIAALQYKGTWAPHPDPWQHQRKTVYVFLKRNNRLPMLESFDAPRTTNSCGRRTQSTHAGQALSLLNGKLSQQHSWSLACRLLDQDTQDLNYLVNQAYRLVLARKPTRQERQLAQQFITQQEQLIRREGTRPPAVAQSEPIRPGVDPTFALALADYCLVLLNLDEFLYVD